MLFQLQATNRFSIYIGQWHYAQLIPESAGQTHHRKETGSLHPHHGLATRAPSCRLQSFPNALSAPGRKAVLYLHCTAALCSIES